MTTSQPGPRPSSPFFGGVAAGLLIALVGCAGKQPTVDLGKPPVWIRAAKAGQPVGRDEIAFRWYGTAGFAVRTAQTTLYFDPYLTRDPAWKLAVGPAISRPETWPTDLPKPDAIFIGHAHFDHYLDAPLFARRSGAKLYASDDALRVARAEGTPDRLLRPILGGDVARVGDVLVEVATSDHSDMITQALDGGPMPEHPKTPMWFLSYKNGPVFSFLIRWRGRTIAHISSAQVREQYLQGRKADVALVCVSGWKATPTFFSRLNKGLVPDVVVPMHHDDFFRPFSQGFHEGPVAATREAYAKIRQDIPAAAILPISFFQEYRVKAVEGHW